MTDGLLASFVAGVGVGLAVAAPVGPMGILCIQRTLTFGTVAGLTTGLASGLVAAAYSLLAAQGFKPAVADTAGLSHRLMLVVSAGLLFWFSLRIATGEVRVGRLAGGDGFAVTRHFREVLIFGLANPLAPILFFAAFPALTSPDDWSQAPVLTAGVFAGVIGWYVALSLSVTCLGGRMSPRVLGFVNKASAAILAALGARALLDLWATLSR